MDFSIGQVVFSKAGRDIWRPFIVVSVEDGYLFLADGKLRPVDKPKKKKRMHVQPTNTVRGEVVSIINSNIKLKDSDLRAALRDFLAEE